jgi:FRG domain-containing protein
MWSFPKSATERRARYTRCEDWQTFEETIRNICLYSWADGGPDVQLIFRGQSRASWALQSCLERQFYKIQRPGLFERYRVQRNPHSREYVEWLTIHLENFKRFSRREKLGLVPQSDDEWWALGRHHGLCTPLLDWTLDPYIAAFFAFNESVEQNESAAIWALAMTSRVVSDPEYFTIVEVPGLALLRQKAQKGLYTLLANGIFTDVESYMSNVDSVRSLWRIEVPRCHAPAVRQTLRDRGVSSATLLLDSHVEMTALERAALEANRLLHNNPVIG